MTDYKYQVPRMRDRDIFSFFIDIAHITKAHNFSINEANSGKSRTFDAKNLQALSEDILAESDLYTIYSANIGRGNFSLSLSRNPTSDANFAFDALNVTNNFNQNDQINNLSESDIHAINLKINSSFLFNTDQNKLLFNNSKTFTTLIASHQKMIEQMQRTIANVGEQAANVRLKQEQEYSAKKAELDAAFLARQAEAEKTLEETKRALQVREDELEARRKELDDRNNTHARRQLHQALKTRIAERAGKFEITAETKRNRVPIHLGVAGSAVVLTTFLYLYARNLTSLPTGADTTVLVISAIKPLGFSVALLGLMAWYLRWMNRWFERYADAEFHLKQFELDIDRASWVVETALEWKFSQGMAIPDHLLENISRNLFSKTEKDEAADMHPADYLASALLGRASGVDLKLPGAELSFTGKDIKKLQADA
ncbi:hypothetical protein FJ941_20740 [Mesorhizobium sp. B2-3-13]|uniref:hypothetical protein n=1 Tax=Mesorhizobium sp. B2-3-13 TaxID=2589951 RepID=UPI0011288BD5|nr:hypothetical protein [Mesorhizobium sp. B2-3-13]TPL79066.1 hypothetical protein FJ941_20740 [Mesorhizobium sp. B2-3-13]